MFITHCVSLQDTACHNKYETFMIDDLGLLFRYLGHGAVFTFVDRNIYYMLLQEAMLTS